MRVDELTSNEYMSYEFTILFGDVNMPGEADRRTMGRLSVYRHVNLTVLSFSSPFCTSQVQSVMRIGAITSGSTSLAADTEIG